MEESLEQGHGPYVFLCLQGALLDGMAGAQAQFRVERLASGARMIGHADLLHVIARAESGLEVLGGEGLEATSLLALLQVARDHHDGVLDGAQALDHVELLSRLAAVEDGQTQVLAGAEASGGVLGGKGGGDHFAGQASGGIANAGGDHLGGCLLTDTEGTGEDLTGGASLEHRTASHAEAEALGGVLSGIGVVVIGAALTSLADALRSLMIREQIE